MRNSNVTADTICRMRDELEQGWRKNHKGNFTREWCGSRLTVFRQRGTWKWCISTPGEDTVFSRRSYATADDAISACVEEAIE